MDAYIEAAAGALRAAQGRAGLTDIELADRSGIPVVTLRRYLKGQRDAPASALFKLASALGITPSDLMEDAMRHLENR